MENPLSLLVLSVKKTTRKSVAAISSLVLSMSLLHFFIEALSL